MRWAWGDLQRHHGGARGRALALGLLLTLGWGWAALDVARAAIPEYKVTDVPTPEPQPQPGAATASAFGERMRTMGDVDGDGAKDVAIANTNFDVGGMVDVGKVWIYSGRTGAILRTVNHPTPQASVRFGFWSAAPGDVDRDGVPDLVTSASGQTVNGVRQGQVYVISGRTGGVLRTIDHPDAPQTNGDFGGNLIAPGDLNGDAVGDFVVTSSGTSTGAGAAYAFSGATGALLYRVLNPDLVQKSSLGFGASEVGDVNRDGAGDYQIGAPFFNEGASMRVGRSYTINGRTGAVLYTLTNPDLEAGARFGQADADGVSLGDVTGDGTPDIYVNGFTSADGAVLNAGAAYLFNGANGQFIRVLRDPSPVASGQFGAANSSAGDIDKDGRPDSLISSRGNVGRVTIFGGRELRERLGTFEDPLQQSGALFGSSMAHLGDVNGDTAPDFLISARSADVGANANVGMVWAFTSVPPPFVPRPAAPAPPPAAPGPAAVVRIRPTAALAQLSRASQRKGERQLRVTVGGSLTGTQGRGCAGPVAVRISVAGKLLRTLRAAIGNDCRFTATARVPVRSLPARLRPRKRKVVLKVAYRFEGNSQLLDAASPTARATVAR